MRHFKILAIAAVAAGALMTAPVGASAAPTLTSPAGTEYTGSINASGSFGSSQLIKAGFANVTCTAASMSGSVTTNTEAYAAGNMSLSFSNCGSATVVNLASGNFEVTSAGSLRISGYKITVGISALGTSCVYGSLVISSTLGTISGGTPATVSVNGQLPLYSSSGFGCANPASWSGSLTFTTPNPLFIK